MLAWLGGLVAGGLLLRLVAHRLATHHRTQQRLQSGQPTSQALRASSPDGLPTGALARWLYLAGERRPDAAARFWMHSAVGLLLGAAITTGLASSGLLQRMQQDLEAIPGRVGLLLTPVLTAAPALLLLGGACWPTLRVRRKHRARQRELLRDLHPTLELLASLAQAGLAFDAALQRILTGLGADRALGRELRSFQAELMGGAERSRCLRRLAHRIDLTAFSSFSAALIRAHEAGISLAETLRRQANELRRDLRERALGRAQSLPARLVFPLVLCFLPGIFVMSLGPAFYGFLVDTSGFGTPR